MSRKRQVIVLVAAATAVALVALVLLPIIVSDDSGSALERARKACEEVAAFERGIEKDDPAKEVLETLSEAEEHAKRAAALDTAWLSLLGGIQSLRLALDQDDPEAAQVGISVIRTECKKTEASGR